MKKYTWLVAFVLVFSLLVSACLGEQVAQETETMDVDELLKKIRKTEDRIANYQSKLERDSILYDLLYPFVASDDLSLEDKDEIILALADELKEKSEEDKKNGVKRDERTKQIPEDLLAFLTGDLAWEEFVDLSIKHVAPEKKISCLAHFGIEITKDDFRRKNPERDAELIEVFNGLNVDTGTVKIIRIEMLDAYFSISQAKERIEEAEAELQQYISLLPDGYEYVAREKNTTESAPVEKPARQPEPERHTSGDYEYIILEDGSVEITRYRGLAEKVAVPDSIDGKSVTSIGREAFYGCSMVEAFTIPDSVISIKDYAFAKCSAIKSIKIPDSVTSIGYNPFYNCAKLSEIIVSLDHPYLATIDGVLFSKPDKRLIAYPCTANKESYTIPNGIRVIGGYAFCYSTSIKTVKIPESVNSIEEYAFSKCISLESMEIPGNVESVGYGAFYGCTSLRSFIINNGVKNIGNSVFVGCSSLTSLELPDSINSIGRYAFGGCSALQAITLPVNLSSIEGALFFGCSSLTSITIPEGVVGIGERAFYGCISLASVSLPNNVGAIGNEAFSGCTSLASIMLPDNVVTIGKEAFSGCSALKEVTIPSGLTVIEDDTFKYCSSLASVSLPENLTRIGNRAFLKCSSLESVVIPDGVIRFQNDAFSGCVSLMSVTIPEKVNEIAESAFDGCDDLTAIVIRDSYAERFCKLHHIKYIYPDSLDWLNE